jgi:redox-sensitive bicupin YhaK (pirin superfamily)
MTETVLETFALGNQWPMRDPFLFCAHHRDAYPAGDGRLGPDASLAGRPLGQDFGDIDGWNMYHGTTVPGFPPHPHRGFETVTYVRRGLIDHADSLGAAARFGRGDVQWLTTGAGIVHSEMFPLLDDAGPNPLELFQIWLNLPQHSKMVDPYFTMLWDADIPRLVDRDGGSEVTVIAGALAGRQPPAPPPDSWASNPDAHVAVWHVQLAAGGGWSMPAAPVGTDRTVYAFHGDRLDIDGTTIAAGTGAAVAGDRAAELTAPGDGVEALVLQGRPIAEPVAQYGPFVLNDRAGLIQAVEDYQSTGFGGWPWPDGDPVHGPDRGRFARHVDGREESPAPG